MIRVLQLVVSMRTGGGPQHVLTLCRQLRSRGVEAIVAGPNDGPLFERFRAEGFETIEVATDRLDPRTLGRTIRLIGARGVRVVHSHGKGAGLYGRLAARARGVPAVHTFHGIHFERYAAPARAAYLMLERALARWTAFIVNVSRTQEAEGLALRLFTPAQSQVIPNGIDLAALLAGALDRGAARAALGLPRGARVVGCAARLDPVKGVDGLLRACAAVPDLQLVLMGAGPEETRLRRLAGAVGLRERARFLGEVPDAATLFRAFDVYASAARKEGMPLAVIEAMALGVAVVASDIAGHREVLGPSAPLAGPEAFGGLLAEVLANPETRRTLGEANRRRSAAFEAGIMADRIAALYGRVLGCSTMP